MNDKTSRLVGLREAALMVGVNAWKISYALGAGYLTEPPRVAGKRAFDMEAIRRLRRYFNVEEKAAND